MHRASEACYLDGFHGGMVLLLLSVYDSIAGADFMNARIDGMNEKRQAQLSCTSRFQHRILGIHNIRS